MRPTKNRFVTVCQQALVIGTAFAVLGPAADVISLDVITRPGAAAQIGAPTTTAPTPAAPAPARAKVETAPVEPTITEVPVEKAVTTPTQVDVPKGGQVVETAPQKVEGYGAVGVTWEHGTRIDEDDITVQARTYDNGVWSDWSDVKYHEEEGPDPGSADALNARPGTDPLIVGDVDQVQTRVVTAAGVEAPDLEMAVVDPGVGRTAVAAKPAISTGGPNTVAEDHTLSTDQGDIALQAGAVVAAPTIYSRAQWGADESWRKGTVAYGTIAAGFIHHTVNANNYTADQVPAMLRSIYAYHTKTKGWNDIGYNFVIDRFGRIWEGRYGGVDKAVVGAHTEGYNSWSFAASALGNFEEVQPSAEMLDAYARLYAWKLSISGVAADDTSQLVGSRTFQAINGHRDAGQTACPGKYLYAQIPAIRVAAARYQANGTTPPPAPRTGTPRATNLVGAGYSDLIARRASDGAAVVLPTGGLLAFDPQSVRSGGWSRYDVKVLSPDLTGDGVSDVFVRVAKSGIAGVRRGLGDGNFGPAVKPLKTLFKGYDLITPVGRFDAGPTADLVARKRSTGDLVLFKGNGAGSFTVAKIASGFGSATKLVGPGDITGDGVADLLVRKGARQMVRYNGNGRGKVGSGTPLAGAWNYPVITGQGDLTGDGLNDVLVRGNDGLTYVGQGTGAGTFEKYVPADGSLGGLSSVAVAPVLGTPEPDAIGFAGDNLVVVPHSGRINVGAPVDTGVSFRDANLVLNVGDWDSDGLADAITRNGAGTLVLFRGTGNGRLAPGAPIDSRSFSGVAMLTPAGDVTGDGKPDLIANRNGQLVVYPGNGRAALGQPEVLAPSVSGTSLLDLGRWDGDTTLDTAVINGAALGWLASSTGSVQALAGDVSGLSGVISAGDVTGDGRRDLIGRTDGGRLWLLAGSAGGFSPRRYLGAGFAGFDLLG